MDLSIRMRTFNNSNYCHANCLKFGDLFFASLTKSLLEAKASICSTIKENLIFYCHKFSVLVIATINYHVLIRKSISQRNVTCNRDKKLYN